MTDDPGMGQLDIWHAGSIIDCLNLLLQDVVFTQPWPGPIVNETWLQAAVSYTHLRAHET